MVPPSRIWMFEQNVLNQSATLISLPYHLLLYDHSSGTYLHHDSIVFRRSLFRYLFLASFPRSVIVRIKWVIRIINRGTAMDTDARMELAVVNQGADPIP